MPVTDTPAEAKNLLVVDDEPVQRLIIGRAAERMGFTVNCAATLEEAGGWLERTDYDVVVLDLNLRDRDGIEVLRRIRELGRDPIMVFISGYDERVRESSARLAVAQGLRVAGTLGKPLSIERFRDLLRSGPERSPSRCAAGATPIQAHELDEALQQGDVYCVFQPKVSLPDRRVVGLEALARWASPRHGPITPDRFIPLAEQSGLIDRLTTKMLFDALQAVRPWREMHPDLSVAVNLSPQSLTDLALPDRIGDVLATVGLPAAALVLEVTEGALMTDYVAAADILTRLRIRGVRVSIDDFGTGHSSLLSLLRLPFSELKIDQSFVRGMRHDPEAEKVIRATVTLARELNLQLVAEGVETEDAAGLLSGLGCNVAQGYLFGRPVSGQMVAERLRAEECQPAAE
jgi:EAL domain-containing protein (putative c-di-GMP-specific phosphodiesterase class I)/ActR/RegA family two-component response regulator